MKDLQQLAEVTSRITAQHPGLAKLTALKQSPHPNPNPLTLANEQPPIELLRRSPRLNPADGGNDPRIQRQKAIADAAQRAIDEKNPNVREYLPAAIRKELDERRRSPRVEISLQKIKDITSAAQRAIDEGRPAAAREALDEARRSPRVQAPKPSAPKINHSSAVPILQQPPAPRVQIGPSVPRVQPTRSVDAPIASRTRAARATQQAANQGPAHNTRSKTCAALERALQTACFFRQEAGRRKTLGQPKILPWRV